MTVEPIHILMKVGAETLRLMPLGWMTANWAKFYCKQSPSKTIKYPQMNRSYFYMEQKEGEGERGAGETERACETVDWFKME
jgi:hypothetical protein